MALTPGQIESAKKSLGSLTHQELLEVQGIVNGIIKQQELVNPNAEQDESTKFLLSLVTDSQGKDEDAAVSNLVRLAQGR